MILRNGALNRPSRSTPRAVRLLVLLQRHGTRTKKAASKLNEIRSHRAVWMSLFAAAQPSGPRCVANAAHLRIHPRQGADLAEARSGVAVAAAAAAAPMTADEAAFARLHAAPVASGDGGTSTSSKRWSGWRGPSRGGGSGLDGELHHLLDQSRDHLLKHSTVTTQRGPGVDLEKADPPRVVDLKSRPRAHGGAGGVGQSVGAARS